MNEKIGIIGATATAVVASICCIGPVVLAGLGIGAVTAAQQFAPFRPYFLTLTAIFLGFGFFFAYRKPKNEPCVGEVCEPSGITRWGRPLLWIATVIVLALVTFPYYYGPLRASLQNPVQPSLSIAPGTLLDTVELQIGGMTCEGCAATIKSKLLETPGVAEVEVHYPAGQARVKYDPAKTEPSKLVAAVNGLGYKASLPKETRGGNDE